MTPRSTSALASTLLALALAGPAQAQAAAESAIILSGTGQGTGSASRSMGSAVANSMNRASDAIAATNAGARRGRGGGSGGAGFVITGSSVDALEGTDAPRIQTGSGATIRTSGRLRSVPPAPATTAPTESGCASNCARADGAPPQEN